MLCPRCRRDWLAGVGCVSGGGYGYAEKMTWTTLSVGTRYSVTITLTLILNSLERTITTKNGIPRLWWRRVVQQLLGHLRRSPTLPRWLPGELCVRLSTYRKQVICSFNPTNIKTLGDEFWNEIIYFQSCRRRLWTTSYLDVSVKL